MQTQDSLIGLHQFRAVMHRIYTHALCDHLAIMQVVESQVRELLHRHFLGRGTGS